MADDRYVLPVTILNGASLSDAINVNANDIVGVMMPAGWTAASITFAALAADGTYGKVQNEGGTEKTLTSPAASTYIHLDTPLRCLGLVKLRSGTAATPVNQSGADRVLKLVLARSS